MTAFDPAGVQAHHADRFPDRPCLMWGDNCPEFVATMFAVGRDSTGRAGS